MDTLKNARHERFAQLIAAGRSQADAYRQVYSRSRGWADTSLHPKASELAGKVSARVTELQRVGVSMAIMTRNELAGYLSKVIKTPIGELGPDSPLVLEYEAGDKCKRVRMVSKIAAADLLCKLMGWYAEERHEVRFSFKPDADFFPSVLGEGDGKGRD